MDSETFRQCKNCKKYSHDVDIRQNDEVQCNECYSTLQTSSRPTPSWPHPQSDVGAAHQSDDSDLRATSMLYESLLDNLNIKQKAKGKKKNKVTYKWKGSLDQLKDFVSLVLKRSGSWHKHKRNRNTFKTGKLTISFYPSTQTLQFQGQDSDKVASSLSSMKNIHRQQGHPASNAQVTFTRPYATDLYSVSSDKVYDQSNTSSFTPDQFGTPAGPENQYETPDALEDAMRKHEEWLEHKQRTEMPTWKDYRISEPELATPDNTVLLKALMHTNNLIGNLDIKSIFQLLQNQIAKAEELHVIIREKISKYFNYKGKSRKVD